jgi:hypothetical protein
MTHVGTTETDLSHSDNVIKRAIALSSLPEETVLTPFMGVGSEVFGDKETPIRNAVKGEFNKFAY